MGATGIEVAGFYDRDWPQFVARPDRFADYYFYDFYEMGRNFFVFEDRHSLFTTGFAGFIQYVCMGVVGCNDMDVKTRDTIERCAQIYPDSNLGFFDTFTNFGASEKRNRLFDDQGRIVSPSDRPVKYATATPQCLNWLVCASAAAGRDLTLIFADRWRMPLMAHHRKIMKRTNWSALA